MKIINYLAIIGLAACCFCPTNGYADNLDKYIVSAQSTNGLVLGITVIDFQGGKDTVDLPRQLVFKAPINTRSVFFIPKEEYLAKIELYDSNNNPVTKTELGSRYGINFNDIYWDIAKFAKRPHSQTNVSDAWSFGCDLPKTSDLFVITKPGKYRLKLEVQIMLYALDTTKKQTRQILRFPPVEITVTKPELPASQRADR